MAWNHVLSIGLLIAFWALWPACHHTNWIISKHEWIYLPDTSRILAAIIIIIITQVKNKWEIKAKIFYLEEFASWRSSLRHLEPDISE